MPRHPTAPPLELWVPFLLALVVVVVVVVVGPLPGTAHSGSDTSSPCDLLLSSVNGVVFHVDVITGTILSRIDTRLSRHHLCLSVCLSHVCVYVSVHGCLCICLSVSLCVRACVC